MTTKNCSNDFPTTQIFYKEISDDDVSIGFLAVACVLALVCIGIFIEELVFLHKVHCANKVKVGKIATMLGLYPVTIIMSVIALLVPTSTVLVDLIASCYLSVCFYAFVTLTIDYFGGEDRMIVILADHPVKLSTFPCCCCCCCILKPVKLTKKILNYLKLFSLQVAFVRPILLCIAAVLWTDGKYETSMTLSSSYIYITILTLISTLLSVYGTVVIVRTSREHLKHFSLWLKFVSFQLMLVLVNLQNFVFSILANNDIPNCIGSRGSRVRASALHHAVLVIDAFLLTLLARKAYRIDEAGIENPLQTIEESGLSDAAKGEFVGHNSIPGFENPVRTIEESGQTNAANGEFVGHDSIIGIKSPV